MRDVPHSGNQTVRPSLSLGPANTELCKHRIKSGTSRMAHVVIEATVLLTETVEVLECIVRREVFELHKQAREDFPHGVHELVHEFVHLQFT